MRADGTIRPVDAVTFDHEHVPTEHLRALQADGISVQPGPDALVNAQDKLVMRKRLREIGAPVPPFMAIESVEDAIGFSEVVAGKVCLKARRGGYDGHGVWFPDAAELPGCRPSWPTGSAHGREEGRPGPRTVRDAPAPSGEVKAWPVVVGAARQHLREPYCSGLDDGRRRAPATCPCGSPRQRDGRAGGGLFETRDAAESRRSSSMSWPRPHNGVDAGRSATGQFEQHMRAVLDYPLGDPTPTAR